MIVGGVELNQGSGNGRPLWGPGAEPRLESGGVAPQKLKYNVTFINLTARFCHVLLCVVNAILW